MSLAHNSDILDHPKGILFESQKESFLTIPLRKKYWRRQQAGGLRPAFYKPSDLGQ
jgi:hypothetical protein